MRTRVLVSQETCPGRFSAFSTLAQRCSGLLSHFEIKKLSWLAFVVLLAACTTHQKPATQSSREIIDDAGRRVSLPARVDRVISLAPNLTEIVFAIGGGDRLVGRTTFCDYPPEAKAVAEIGDTLHPSLERVIALHPQVVLISTASQLEVFTQQLQNQNIAVFVTDPRDLDGVFRSIEQVGEILGQQQQAVFLVQKLRDRAHNVEESVKQRPPVRVFYQLSAEPLYTIGHDAFETDLIRRAGGISVTADVPGAWPRYSNESALAAKPDAIILPTGGSMGVANSNVIEALHKSPAMLAGRVFKINGDYLVRPGPRAVDGLEAMAKALHPEAFKQ